MPQLRGNASWFISLWVILATLAATLVQAVIATIDTTPPYQSTAGFGGAVAFYGGWVTAHPCRLEIYTHAFAGLNLSTLRSGDGYQHHFGRRQVTLSVPNATQFFRLSP